MKTNLFRLMAIMLGMSILVSACKKDEEPGVPATMLELTINDDNTEATIVFTEGVYKMNNKTGNLDKTSFLVTITGGSATLSDFEVTHTAGAASAVINLTLSGIVNGQEVLKVTPNTTASIYNAAGVAVEATQNKTVTMRETGIIGRWYSSGANVAPILLSLGIDSIYADFKVDGSYLVESFSGGSKTTLTGNFQQTKSTNGNIWDITVNQNQPSSLVSKGIFEVTSGASVTMRYEIAQTDPEIPGVTPPTAAAGFGSTSGGAFGTLNIQTYIRM
ncbi:MAG: hypothetical protein CVT92_14995 [Bacteroidetes bacterium HGW-Bacteroidetes-1]|jgi:hypothetical protein|nr:MAG: hypothetical protein CVT92_14995 [Bacteroidetes bacterium HGW-Bacteroidetes-1]